MTGTALAANGAVGMGADPTWPPPHLLAGELTAAGYQTKMIGKSHVRGRGSSSWRYGFEHAQVVDNSNTGDAELTQWRQRLVELLRERPEGFVRDGELMIGRPHDLFIPGYDPSRLYLYL